MVALAEFKIIGLTKLVTKAKKIKTKLERRRTINHKAVIVMDRWIQKNFQQQGKLAVQGGWDDISPATKERRRKGINKKRRGQFKILQDTGQLRQRWEHVYTNRMAKITSNVDYGIYHEKGTKRIPQRKIMPTEKQVMPELKKLFTGWVRTNLK